MQSAQQLSTDISHEDTEISKPVVLCVDDEPQILSSLKRLFRRSGYQMLTAENGNSALALLEEASVDLVISDMRMPGMNGAELLAHVAERWPETMRILLTGYADLESTIDAINRGRLFRYVGKPWDDTDLKVTVESALEQKRLKDEHERLQELIKRRNEELNDLNQHLEDKVKARTREIAKATDLLRKSFGQLQQSYQDAITVFSSLLELRDGTSAGHGRYVADIATAVANELGLEADLVTAINNAALLHDIGKIGLPDELLRIPINALDAEQLAQYREHPVTGQAALMSLPHLESAAEIIRSHHERYDGKGFPDASFGDRIPIGARVLAVANDFEDLQSGALLGEQLDYNDAREYILKNASSRYDPDVVAAFAKVAVSDEGERRDLKELKLGIVDVTAGMVLSRDLLSPSGLLLLRTGQQLSDALIEKIRRLHEPDTERVQLYVRGVANDEE